MRLSIVKDNLRYFWVSKMLRLGSCKFIVSAACNIWVRSDLEIGGGGNKDIRDE